MHLYKYSFNAKIHKLEIFFFYNLYLFSTLEEALKALEASDVLKEALGSDFVAWYCLLKRAGEIKVLKNSDMKVDDEKAFQEERNMYAKFM